MEFYLSVKKNPKQPSFLKVNMATLKHEVYGENLSPEESAVQTFGIVSASTSFAAAIMTASLFVSSIYSSFASSSSVSSEDTYLINFHFSAINNGKDTYSANIMRKLVFDTLINYIQSRSVTSNKT